MNSPIKKHNLSIHNWPAFIISSSGSLHWSAFIRLWQIPKWSSLKNKIKQILKVYSQWKFKPWMTGQLFELITRWKQVHDKVKKQPCDSKLKTEYSKFRNFVTSKISAAKRKFYQCKFEDCKGNNNDKWKFINNLLNKKNYDSTPTSLDDNGKITSDPTKICNIFNDYFANIGTKLANELPECATNFKSYLPTIEGNLSFKFEEIDTTEIVNIIRNLNLKKASGYDQITTRSIKENILVLAPVLTELVNMMFRESVFPDCLKVAKVIPLFKKGSKFKIQPDKL